MSKLDDLIQSIKNLRTKKNKTVEVKEQVRNDENDETEDDDEKKDSIDNTIQEPKTSTVNKKKLKGILILVGAFIISVIVGLSYSSTDKTVTKDIEAANGTNSSINKNIEGDDYTNVRLKNGNNLSDEDKLKMYENEKTTKLVLDNNVNKNTSTDYDEQDGTQGNIRKSYIASSEPTSGYSRPVPVLGSVPNYNNSYVNPYMNVQQRPINEPQTATKNTTTNNSSNTSSTKNDKKDDILSSAIAFIQENTNMGSSTQTPTSTTEQVEQTAMIYTPASDNAINAGTLIPMMLMNGINSQTGGQIVAQVQSDVYDSLNGVNVLIPMGARLIGTYNSGAKDGQDRVDVSWQNLIMPDGSSYTVNGLFQSTDENGYPGIPGRVNNHNGSKISAGVFSSALAALGSIATGNNSYGTDYGWHDSGQLAMQGASANLLNTASEIFKKKLNVDPEITVEAGTTFCVSVVKPINF